MIGPVFFSLCPDKSWPHRRSDSWCIMEKMYVCSFNEGKKEMTDLLGLKGASLAEMTRIGIPVPYGFTITTEASRKYYGDGNLVDPLLEEEIRSKLEELEQVIGRRFGDPERPLLLAVRPSAPVRGLTLGRSILDVGLTRETVEPYARSLGDRTFALDCYARLIRTYSTAAYGMKKELFTDIVNGRMAASRVSSAADLSEEDEESLVQAYEELVRGANDGRFIPQDPKTQLMDAIVSGFDCWQAPEIRQWKKACGVPEDLGIAVTVQAMVFGNKDEHSGTGVAFTRNPVTGEKQICGEFFRKAQGEDISTNRAYPGSLEKMTAAFPEAKKNFIQVCNVLEEHYRDVQSVEFSVDAGRLYILQTASAGRTAQAAVKTAVDMVEEKLITRREAVMRLRTDQVEYLIHSRFSREDEDGATLIARGTPASPGAASGQIVFTAEDARQKKSRGISTILVCRDIAPEGLSGMRYADGVLTAAGSRSIYAASLAGGQGVCCVTDCPDLTIDEEQGLLRIGDAEFARGDYISISGFNGRVYDGRLTVQPPYDWDAFGKIMSWADSFRHLRVRVNADTPADAALALRLGAEGVGLCRSERMFYNEERAAVMRRAVLAPSPAVRREMVQKMMEFQIRDFTEIFRIMCTRPVTIRLLDPSLSVFLIGAEDDFRTMASEWGISEEEVRERASSFYEVNQTMGERGVRVGIEYPDILSMQAEAIFRAAAAVARELEKEPDPEILVPFVVSGRELAQVKKLIRDAASRVREEEERTVEYRLGSMIEVPRAALTAGEIAEEAEFFSFGTNDLTQLVMGLSREGSGHIVRKYREQKILDRDPFLTLDQEGVGRLMMYAVEAGRKTRPNLKAGICGTHAGDPDSIDFCSRIGLNYVSCQARQVPVARLAAAQADIRAEGDRDE